LALLGPVTITVAPAAPPPPSPTFTLLAVLAALRLILTMHGRRPSAFRWGGRTILRLLLLLALTLLLPPGFMPLTLVAFLVGPWPAAVAMLLSGLGARALCALMRGPLPSTIAPPALTLVAAVPISALTAIL
jgi:hypothetical protein